MYTDEQTLNTAAQNLKEYRWTKLYQVSCLGDLNIFVDFDLRDSKKMENMKKLNKIIFYNKNVDIHKTA